jgi:uncharacterized protein involved in exopolysaccharide biosynthesis
MTHQPTRTLEDLRETLTEGLSILRRRWRLAIVGLSVAGSAAFWLSQYVPREYTATTTFERRDDVVLQNLVQSRSPYSFDRLKATLIMDMTGSRAVGRALVRLGLLPADSFSGGPVVTERERAAVDDVARRLRLRTDVRLIHSSADLDTIQLTCAANDPDVARQLAIALRDQYVADTRERLREILHGARDFFAAEIARLQERVAAADAQLREDLGALSSQDVDLVGLSNRLEILRAQRDNAYQRRVALAADVSAREAFLAQGPGPPEESGAPSSGEAPAGAAYQTDTLLDQAIEQARREIVNLMTVKRMTAEHPAVRTARERLEQLELLRQTLLTNPPPELAALATQLTDPATSQAYRQWQAQRLRVEMELESLRKQLAAADEQLADADRRLGEFQRLYDRLVNKDGDVRTLLDERTQAARELGLWREHLLALERVLTAEAGERGTQFALLEEAEEAIRPSSPRIASVFVVCSAVGLAVAVLLAALGEIFDRSFRSADQVSRVLGVPVLESVGVIPTPQERRRAVLSATVWWPALGMLLLGLVVSVALAYASFAGRQPPEQVLRRVFSASETTGLVSGPMAAEPAL